jgi:hypothetical protein
MITFHPAEKYIISNLLLDNIKLYLLQNAPSVYVYEVPIHII